MILDTRLERVIAKDIHKSVSWYLMASYAYYVEDDPILSDASFDKLARTMRDHWDEIDHPHKYLITEEDLDAGSLLIRQFPEVVTGALRSLRVTHVPTQQASYALQYGRRRK